MAQPSLFLTVCHNHWQDPSVTRACLLITHVCPGHAMIHDAAPMWWRRSGFGRLEAGMKLEKKS